MFFRVLKDTSMWKTPWFAANSSASCELTVRAPPSFCPITMTKEESVFTVFWTKGSHLASTASKLWESLVEYNSRIQTVLRSNCPSSSKKVILVPEAGSMVLTLQNCCATVVFGLRVRKKAALLSVSPSTLPFKCADILI